MFFERPRPLRQRLCEASGGLTAKQRFCDTMCYMLAPEQVKVIVSFLLDGAKILFGSLVVGIFAPSVTRTSPKTLE